MAALPLWLQPLLEAGILGETAPPPKAEWVTPKSLPPGVLGMQMLGTRFDPTTTPKILPPTNSLTSPEVIEAPSKPQIKVKRSPLLRAYAHSLRGLITPDNNLGATKQALFIASPLQKGIPVGIDKEFINEAVYQHGNAVQSPLSPVYRAGSGDYFGWLNKYVSNIRDVFSGDGDAEKEARKAYIQAKANADAEYEKAVTKFERVRKLDATVTFKEWMKEFSTDYLDACKDRDELANKLRPSSVKLVKEIFDDAQARLEPKQGNNMPCAYLDPDMVAGDNAQKTDIVYRPRYYLSGYNSAAKRWRDEYMTKIRTPEQRIISLKGLKGLTWSQLGITDSDDTNETGDILDFPFDVALTYTGIGVFDVKRGLWDIDGFRTLLPELAGSAPPDCGQPVYKTTKLLLGYGVDLVLKLPQVVNQEVADKLRLMPGVLDDFPLTLIGGNELHAKPQTNDAYPVLLAVLANMC